MLGPRNSGINITTFTLALAQLTIQTNAANISMLDDGRWNGVLQPASAIAYSKREAFAIWQSLTLLVAVVGKSDSKRK